MKSEKKVTNEVLLHISEHMPELRLLRNHVGMIEDKNGKRHKFGLGTGSADFVGIKTVTITPDMVGQKLGVAIALEMKKEKGGKESEAQKRWGAAVRRRGGLYAVVSCIDDLKNLC